MGRESKKKKINPAVLIDFDRKSSSAFYSLVNVAVGKERERELRVYNVETSPLLPLRTYHFRCGSANKN